MRHIWNAFVIAIIFAGMLVVLDDKEKQSDQIYKLNTDLRILRMQVDKWMPDKPNCWRCHI